MVIKSIFYGNEKRMPMGMEHRNTDFAVPVQLAA